MSRVLPWEVMIQFLFHVGRYSLMLSRMFARPENFRMYWLEFVRQTDWMGPGSLVLVLTISVFVGAVTTLQSAYQLVTELIPVSVIGSIVSDSTILELAPTITCLVLAGRIGSRLASEIGSMRVSEQIDALKVMGIQVEAYLLGPRMFAGILMIPMLVVISAIASISAGMVFGHIAGIVPAHEFLQGAQETFRPFNVVICMAKAFAFAFIICSVSLYEGFYVEGGALDVGRASTRAVVISSLGILLADYFIAELFL